MEDINFKNLAQAVIKTFRHRETPWNYDEFKELLDDINESTIMGSRWKGYAKSHSYASDIEFTLVIQTIKNLIYLLDKQLELAVVM